MVEIRVVVLDAADAHGLLSRLVGMFGPASVSFDGTRNELQVSSEWQSRSVLAVIDAVQTWLAADGVASAELSVGKQTYTMVGPTPAPQNGRGTASAGRAA